MKKMKMNIEKINKTKRRLLPIYLKSSDVTNPGLRKDLMSLWMRRAILELSGYLSSSNREDVHCQPSAILTLVIIPSPPPYGYPTISNRS